MSRRGAVLPLLLVALSWARIAFAQESTSFRMTEHVFNAGGHPAGGVTMQSARYLMSLDSIGEGLSQAGISGTRYIMDGGFGDTYPPPGEVVGLRFETDDLLRWDPEPSAGRYNVYRDTVTSLPGAGGYCIASNLTDTALTETTGPASGQGWFYLVAVENILGELGTTGTASSGTTRITPDACP